MVMSLGELRGDGKSPGGGELISSSPGLGEAAEFGVIEPESSSPSTLSPSSGDPSSPPSPEKKEKFRKSKGNNLKALI